MIPLRRTNIKLSDRWPRKIVFHHAVCRLENAGGFAADLQKFQIDKFQNYFWSINKEETGFHYIIDRVNDDYFPVVSQPILSRTNYTDLTDIDNTAIHIAFMGDYNILAPKTRLYKVLAFRLLAPLTRFFYLEEDSFFFHSTISSNSECTCPGLYVDMGLIKEHYREMVRKQRVYRRS